MLYQARVWGNHEMLQKAENLEMRSCKQLEELVAQWLVEGGERTRLEGPFQSSRLIIAAMILRCVNIFEKHYRVIWNDNVLSQWIHESVHPFACLVTNFGALHIAYFRTMYLCTFNKNFEEFLRLRMIMYSNETGRQFFSISSWTIKLAMLWVAFSMKLDIV